MTAHPVWVGFFIGWALLALLVFAGLMQGRAANTAADRPAASRVMLFVLALAVGGFWIPIVAIIGVKAVLRWRERHVHEFAEIKAKAAANGVSTKLQTKFQDNARAEVERLQKGARR